MIDPRCHCCWATGSNTSAPTLQSKACEKGGKYYLLREATTTDCVCTHGKAKLVRREATTTDCVCKDGRAKLVRREAATTDCVCKEQSKACEKGGSYY